MKMDFPLRVLLLVGIATAPAMAQQQVTVTTPMQRIQASYYEQSGVNWSLGGPNWFANSGGGPLAPPFGRADPNSGLRGGVGFHLGGGASGRIGFGFAQGSHRSIVGAAPSLTVTEGQPGHFFSGQVSPFVTGLRPVVGNYPTIVDPVAAAARQQQHAQLSAIVEGQAQMQNDHLRRYLKRAEIAESEGNLKMARANYRLAMPLAPPPLRLRIQQQVQAMVARAKAERHK